VFVAGAAVEAVAKVVVAEPVAARVASDCVVVVVVLVE